LKPVVFTGLAEKPIYQGLNISTGCKKISSSQDGRGLSRKKQIFSEIHPHQHGGFLGILSIFPQTFAR
jgi:hypothetical protein